MEKPFAGASALHADKSSTGQVTDTVCIINTVILTLSQIITQRRIYRALVTDADSYVPDPSLFCFQNFFTSNVILSTLTAASSCKIADDRSCQNISLVLHY